MQSSPWDGADRRPIRIGLAAVAVLSAVSLLGELSGTLHASPRPDAPAVLMWIAQTPAIGIMLGVIVAAAAWLLAAGRRVVLAGIVIVAALGLIAEARAARFGGPFRADFFSGLAVLGWTLGYAFGTGERPSRERWAELGAVSLLAAAYVSAGLGKLLGAGPAWADADTLRAVILSHAEVAGDGWARPGVAWVVRHPGVTRAFGVATLVVQLGAVLMALGPRLRAIAAIGIIGFHLGVFWLTGIGYWPPVLLVALLSFPWGRRGAAESGEPVERSRWTILAVSSCLVVIGAWLLPGREYTQGHHRATGSPESRQPAVRLGSVEVGTQLAGGWRVASIDREPDRTRLVVADDAGRRAVVFVSAQDEGPSSPYDTERFRIAYGPTTVPREQLDAPLYDLGARLESP